MILVNKWDGMSAYERSQVEAQIDRKFGHMGNIPIKFISAKFGKQIDSIMPLVDKLHVSALANMGTGKLNRVIGQAQEKRNPPMIGNHRIKIKFAHQGGMNPPHVILHGNQLDKLPQTYLRYLSKSFEKAFDLVGTRVRISLKNSENPYDKGERRFNSNKDKERRRGGKSTRSKK